MEVLGIVDLVLQIIVLILLIFCLVLLLKIYVNLMKFLRLWDRFYGNEWLYGRPDFE